MHTSIKTTGVLLVIWLPFSLFGQTFHKLKTANDVIPLLCHKWGISLKTDSVVKQISPAESIPSINFNADGTLIIDKLSVVKGSWHYDVKTQVLAIKTKDKNEKYKILNITDKELILEKKDKGRQAQKERLIRIA
ncbi:MAG: hypothetical protein M9933_14870 [Chitinophagaceae bacterium]|nr:hypothetical protein [Chitinophagaceae bacterium]